MIPEPLRLKFWGVRGSVANPSPAMAGYGGNTSCLSLALSGDEHVLLDCGTGARVFGRSLEADGPPRPRRFHVFLTHYHLDHIQGLPFFAPLYDPLAEITFYGAEDGARSARKALHGLLTPPFFPVSLEKAPSRIAFAPLTAAPVSLGELTVSTQALHHPNGATGLRLERGGRRIVYATDHEHGDPGTDAALVRFAAGAEALIYDAMFSPEEYARSRRGWGHSTWEEGVKLALAAGARTLVLFHHHPDHTDADLDALLDDARRRFPSVELAREGLDLAL